MPALRKQYINCHAHFHGSLLDGMSTMENYAQRAIELGQPAVCSTDHGNLYSLMENYKVTQKLGIPYFFGIEAYFARKTRWDRDGEERSGPASDEWEQRGPHHQTILAYNNEGYHNLLKLSSDSYTEGFFSGRARIDKELMAKYSKGLVAFSSCLSGEVPSALLRDDFPYALKAAAEMQDIVGKENYFIEIMDHGIEEEKRVHNGLIEISKRINAPLVITLDSHYVHKEDSDFHDYLLCLTTNSKKTNPQRFKFVQEQFYLRSYDEVCKLAPVEWVENSMLIFDKYDINLDFSESHYPVFSVPQEHIDVSIPQFFKAEIARGAEYRFGPEWRTERRDVADRLNLEIEVIQDMGYDSYFLIVADIINWCRENNILTGPGRGSSSGSCVSYCLGITHVDPLEHDLLFERFLTPGRIPDIDIDVDDMNRDRVLQYIRDKYGHDHTAQIITLSRLKAKSVINDVARVLDHPFDFAQEIVATMPPAQFGVSKTLKECLDTEEFKKKYEEDEAVKQVVDVGLKLEGLWRTDGIHAGGIIVADKPVYNYCPIQQKGEGEPIVTQWDMRTTEEIGLLKIDMLGLRNLGIIEGTLERVREKEGVDLGYAWDIVKISDPDVFRSLSEGNTSLVFQMASDGLTTLAKEMGIDSIDDIMAALALYRPGPMGSGFHYAYARRKRGEQRSVPLHPLLTDILSDTYQILLYQEQIMRIAKELAGFDPIQSNKFLKSIGKKDREAMAATKRSFVEGCMNTSGISKSEADGLFGAIEPHADYSFAKSHAAAYAYISYVTAYLKYYYPSHYSAAYLTSVMFEAEEKFRPVLLDVREKVGIEVTSPSVNRSQFKFDSDSEKVVYSISGLKRIGEKKSTPFVNFRNESEVQYNNIHQFFREANTDILDKIFVESLVYSGSMDELVSDDEVENVEVDIEAHLEVLLLELQTLGVCITENPFDIYYNNIKFQRQTLPASQIGPGKSKFDYCGVVRDPEFKVSKAGRRFIKFQIDDGKGIVDCLLIGRFVESIEQTIGKLEEVLTSGAFITFYGNLKEEEDRRTIFVIDIKSVHSPETMGDLINSVIIPISPSDDLDEVYSIISKNPGGKKVFIDLKHPDVDIIIRKLLTTRINEDGEKLLREYIEVK